MTNSDLKCPVCGDTEVLPVENAPPGVVSGVVYCKGCKVVRYIENIGTVRFSVMKKK